MYEGYYGLKENPFRLTPDPAFICMTPQHQEALSGLIYSVCTRPGLTVLVGEAGTGKTTLLHALAGLLEKRRYVTAVCTNPMLNREEFYDLLMIKFAVECQSTLKSRQLVALERQLERGRLDGCPSLLIIDEAQRLPMDLLEEIRLLLNLETDREKLLEIILAGQPELLEILGRHEARQFKQRVSCICRLKPLSRDEVREYLFHRMTRAGLPGQTLFSEICIDLIYDYTGGIPRLVNALCDSSLQVGFGLKSARITPSILEEAARDLELVRSVVTKRFMPAEAAHVDGTARPGAPAELHTATAETATAEAAPDPSVGEKTTNNRTHELRIPLQAYADRQKSLGLFAGLMERWK